MHLSVGQLLQIGLIHLFWDGWHFSTLDVPVRAETTPATAERTL